MSELLIDWSLCTGHGLCAELSEGTITRDDWGYPILPVHRRGRAHPQPHTEENEMTEKTARRVVGICPALALRLEPTA